MVTFICYSRCSTCAKARAWLEKNGIEYSQRDIKQQNPTADELEVWWKKSGLDLKRFFNTSGIGYRELGLKDRLNGMKDAEKLALLATDGMLCKRPILVAGDTVLVGFKQPEWEAALIGGALGAKA